MSDQPQPISPEDRELQRRAEIGDKLEAFLGTAAGRHLTEQAQADIDSAFTDFLAADPSDEKAVAAAQRKALVAEAALAYIRDAIVAGDNAKTAIEAATFVD
jgi:hypothetical protein